MIPLDFVIFVLEIYTRSKCTNLELKKWEIKKRQKWRCQVEAEKGEGNKEVKEEVFYFK